VSRHFTGHDGKFLTYLARDTGFQVLLVIGIVFYGFNIVERSAMRWDLTEDKRFSISDYSRELVGGLENPLTIRAYFSEELPPRIQPLQRQVFDVLAEYVAANSSGRVRLERRDPLKNSADETEATNYGVQPIQLRVFEATKASALQVYGGIVLLYGDKQSEVINIAERYTQGYEGLSGLESELTGRIYQLTHDKPKVGITGYLEREAGGNPWDRSGGRPQPEFSTIRRVLGKDAEIETVDLDETEPDPRGMPLLLVVRPKEFSDVALYRLDQYLMKGGRIVVFVTLGTIEASPFGGGGYSFSAFPTGLEAWLEHNGVRIPREVVCQFGNAYEIPIASVEDTPFGRMKVERPAKNWFWPIVGLRGAFDESNPAVHNLEPVLFVWPHPVDVLENRLAQGVTATTLVQSHAEESWRWSNLSNVDRRRVKEGDPCCDRRASASGSASASWSSCVVVSSA
jgi:ABC-type uncharacterized transport system involved in gliding motility auxiliary subunit